MAQNQREKAKVMGNQAMSGGLVPTVGRCKQSATTRELRCRVGGGKRGAARARHHLQLLSVRRAAGRRGRCARPMQSNFAAVGSYIPEGDARRALPKARCNKRRCRREGDVASVEARSGRDVFAV